MPDEEIVLWKGEFTADQSRQMARDGVSMPDGSYPIPDADHLGKAIRAVGRGTNNGHDAIRRHIAARAKALGLSSRIPDDWGQDGRLQKAEDVEVAIPLWKSESQRLVYGVVLSPEVKDSQGDIIAAGDIQKAAHRWLAEYRKHDVQHDEQVVAVEPVESFIAPADMTIAGEPVVKGAWVIGAHVTDDVTWAKIEKGEITGWSIGGSGVRTPIS